MVPLAARVYTFFDGDVVEVSPPEILVAALVFGHNKLASVRHVSAIEIGDIPVVFICHDSLVSAGVAYD